MYSKFEEKLQKSKQNHKNTLINIILLEQKSQKIDSEKSNGDQQLKVCIFHFYIIKII